MSVSCQTWKYSGPAVSLLDYLQRRSLKARCGPSLARAARAIGEVTMRRLGCMIALLALPLCAASADTAMPGLIEENLRLPITLPDGSRVKLEAMVIRPDRPERFPLVILVHGTIRATGEALRSAMA